MSDSILGSTKVALGIPEDYSPFDTEILLHINSAISELTQLGVGPKEGFRVNTKLQIWADFYNQDPRFEMVKSYVFARVKMLFDPPTPGYVYASFEKIIQEYAWRITVASDEIADES